MIKNNGYIKALHQKQQSILDSMDKNDLVYLDVYSAYRNNNEEEFGKILLEKEEEYIKLKNKLNKNMESSSMKKRFFFKKARQKMLNIEFTKTYNELKHLEKTICVYYTYYDKM